MCCVKGDKVFIKVTYTQNYANTKAARPFTSDTIVWLGKHAEFTSKQPLFAIQDLPISPPSTWIKTYLEMRTERIFLPSARPVVLT